MSAPSAAGGMFHCELCDRAGATEMAACPRRARNKCAYRVVAQPLRGAWRRARVPLAGALLLTVIGLAGALLLGGVAGVMFVLVCSVVVVGLVLYGVGLARARHLLLTPLQQPTSHSTLGRQVTAHTALGRTLFTSWVAWAEPVGAALLPSPALTMPTSHAATPVEWAAFEERRLRASTADVPLTPVGAGRATAEDVQAAYVVLAAVIGLVAVAALRVWRVEGASVTASGQPPRPFALADGVVVCPGDTADQRDGLGTLETRLLAQLDTWPTRPVAATRPEGALLADLVAGAVGVGGTPRTRVARALGKAGPVPDAQRQAAYDLVRRFAQEEPASVDELLIAVWAGLTRAAAGTSRVAPSRPRL